MKTPHRIHAILALLAATAALRAEPASSAAYTVPAAALDAGGGRAASATYAHELSFEGFAIGEAATANYIVAHGPVFDTSTTPPPTDNDGDGLPNTWELAHGLNPNNAADALSDTDADGATAYAEYAFGLHPQVNDAAGIVPVGTVAGRLALAFPRRIGGGVRYTVQVSTDLATWLDGALFTDTGDTPAPALTLETSRIAGAPGFEIIAVRENLTAPQVRLFLRVKVSAE